MASKTTSTQTTTAVAALSTAHPDTLLTRRAAAVALTEAGYPTAPATLARKACVGGGPLYRRYGPRVVYRWADLLEWAQSRLGPPVRSTAEMDAARRSERAPATDHLST
jgi:hypothetical protein